MSNHKHLTEEQRAFIAEALQSQLSFKKIAEILGKDPTTISKEVKANRVYQPDTLYNAPKSNLCIHSITCDVVLTDNGSEFLDMGVIEQSIFDYRARTRVYYCEPYASFQKGGIEKNHEYIRWVLPKGASFNDLVAGDVSLLASHINSIARDSLDGLTPSKAFEIEFNPSLLTKLQLVHIEPDEVNLTRNLIY